HAGQIGVGLAGVDGPRVGSADAALALIPVPALAAKDVPARLVEDRQLLQRTFGTAVSTSAGAQALGLLPMFADSARPWHVGGARRVDFGSSHESLDDTRRALVFRVFATDLLCSTLSVQSAQCEIHAETDRC